MFRKFLWILALLLVSNLATFFWSETRLRDLREQDDLRLEASALILREHQKDLTRLQGEVNRLEAWGHLVDFQEVLRNIAFEIEKLNYGNALGLLDELESQIRDGELGSLLAESSADLEDDFESVRAELKSMSGSADTRLRSLGRGAFEALSGFSAEVGQTDGFEVEEDEPSSSPSLGALPDPSAEEPSEALLEPEPSGTV